MLDIVHQLYTNDVLHENFILVLSQLIESDKRKNKHLAETKHVADEMSATSHQTNYLYIRNASYVIDVTCAKYKH